MQIIPLHSFVNFELIKKLFMHTRSFGYIKVAYNFLHFLSCSYTLGLAASGDNNWHQWKILNKLIEKNSLNSSTLLVKSVQE